MPAIMANSPGDDNGVRLADGLLTYPAAVAKPEDDAPRIPGL